MRYNWLKAAALLLILLHALISFGQDSAKISPVQNIIRRDPPLPYKECKPKLLHVDEKDSVRQHIVLDSLAALFTGSWELAEEGAGACFVPAHAPTQYTVLVLDRQGKGTVYIRGSQVTTFQLLLSFYWGNVHFAVNNLGNKPYFDFLPSFKSRNSSHYDPEFEGRYRNKLRVCEETLILTGPRTGLSYVFRRLSTK